MPSDKINNGKKICSSLKNDTLTIKCDNDSKGSRARLFLKLERKGVGYG